MVPSKTSNWWVVYCLIALQLLAVNGKLVAQSTQSKVHSAPADISAEALLLQEYVRIPSETGNETKAAKFLMQQCRERGLIVNQFIDSMGCTNFSASLYPLQTGKPNIIFLNHMDVVPAGDTAAWTYPAYSGEIAEGKLWSRGSTDNKGLAVVQLSAVERFVDIAKNRDLPYNVTLLCVSGEETGGSRGSALVSRNHIPELNPSVVIGEGGCGLEDVSFLKQGATFFGISVAEKSMLWLEVSCKLEGEGHASMAGGDYANKHLIIGLNRLLDTRQPIQVSKAAKLMFRSTGEKTGGLKGFAMTHINWRIFRPYLKRNIKQNPELESILCNTISISNLGSVLLNPNQISQKAIAYLDCRLLPGSSAADMIAFISNTFNDSLLQINTILEQKQNSGTRPGPFFTQLEKAIKHTFSKAEVIPILFPASSDNHYYRTESCPVYGFNPWIMSQDQIKSIHNTNEYIDLEDIDKGIEVFENFLRSVLLKEDPASSALNNRQ